MHFRDYFKTSVILAVITAVSFLLSPAIAQNKSEDRLCHEMKLDESQIWHDDDITDYFVEVLQDNCRTYRQINWSCISTEFEKISPNTSVRRIEGAKVRGRTIYRFTLDRTKNLFVALFTIGPGKSKGRFTAVINILPSGKLLAIRKGGREEWLIFE